jgi:hypothetical protein
VRKVVQDEVGTRVLQIEKIIRGFILAIVFVLSCLYWYQDFTQGKDIFTASFRALMYLFFFTLFGGMFVTWIFALLFKVLLEIFYWVLEKNSSR